MNIHRPATLQISKAVVFSQTLSPNIFKYRDHWWDLPTIWKTRFLQKNIVQLNWYVQSSCLQFFTTTTGIQSGLGSYTEVLEKILAKLFALSDAKDNTSGLLNRGVTADLAFLRTLLAIWQKSEEPSFCEMIKSYFIRICKFGSFKTLQGSN